MSISNNWLWGTSCNQDIFLHLDRASDCICDSFFFQTFVLTSHRKTTCWLAVQWYGVWHLSRLGLSSVTTSHASHVAACRCCFQFKACSGNQGLFRASKAIYTIECSKLWLLCTSARQSNVWMTTSVITCPRLGTSLEKLFVLCWTLLCIQQQTMRQHTPQISVFADNQEPDQTIRYKFICKIHVQVLITADMITGCNSCEWHVTSTDNCVCFHCVKMQHACKPKSNCQLLGTKN